MASLFIRSRLKTLSILLVTSPTNSLLNDSQENGPLLGQQNQKTSKTGRPQSPQSFKNIGYYRNGLQASLKNKLRFISFCDFFRLRASTPTTTRCTTKCIFIPVLYTSYLILPPTNPFERRATARYVLHPTTTPANLRGTFSNTRLVSLKRQQQPLWRRARALCTQTTSQMLAAEYIQQAYTRSSPGVFDATTEIM